MKKPDIKVIATDLDGTLFNTDHHMDETTKQKLQQAEAAGVRIIICTGRDYAGALASLGDHGLDCDYILISGGEIRNNKGEVLQRIAMEPDCFFEILERQKGLNMAVRFCTGKKDYIIGREEEFEQMYLNEARLFFADEYTTDEALLGSEMFKRNKARTAFVSSLKELLEMQIPIFKVFMSSGDVQEVEEASRRMADLEGVASASSFINNVELTHIDAQKGPVLKGYIESLGYTMDQVMVLGDSMNDYSMISMDFGMTVAMENAMDEIKRAAKFITKNNDEYGVAYAIDQFVEL